jgi:hypothetical protein
MRLRFHLAITLCLASLLAGCLSPKKKVAARYNELRVQWTTNLLHQAQLPEQSLDWPAATVRLHAQNLKLRSARFEITNSQESVRQVFKDLIPTLNLHANVSRSLKSLPTTTFDDVTFNVDSFFNIPGIANMNARYFGARLTLLRAHLGYELAEREQTIELYKLMLGFQETREQSAQLQTEQQLAQTIQKADPLVGQSLLEELKSRRLTLEKQAAGLQSAAGDLFADHGRRWNLQTNGWPVLPYFSQPLPLADSNRVAQLQIKLIAVELVGAWAQIKGIKLQYWPELTIFVTGPPLYQHYAGGQQFWNWGDVRANADFFWRLDTRGEVSRQLRQARRDQDLQRARVREEALALMDKLLIAQKLTITLREQFDQLRQFLPLLDRVPSPQDYAGILKTIETNRSLHEQERKLRRDLAELNTLFWFVDEAQWKSGGAGL